MRHRQVFVVGRRSNAPAGRAVQKADIRQDINERHFLQALDNKVDRSKSQRTLKRTFGRSQTACGPRFPEKVIGVDSSIARQW